MVELCTTMRTSICNNNDDHSNEQAVEGFMEDGDGGYEDAPPDVHQITADDRSRQSTSILGRRSRQQRDDEEQEEEIDEGEDDFSIRMWRRSTTTVMMTTAKGEAVQVVVVCRPPPEVVVCRPPPGRREPRPPPSSKQGAVHARLEQDRAVVPAELDVTW